MKRLSTLLLMTVLLLSGCRPLTNMQEYDETQFILDTVCIIKAGGSNARSAVNAAFAKIREIQTAVDFYSADSTVSAFNRAGAGEPIDLDSHTAAILTTALEVSRSSGGAFDVTIAPVQRLWNFKDTDAAVPPSEDEIQKRLSLVGYEELIFDSEAQTLSKTTEGVEIDLGGAAKGYAADQAAQVLRDYGVLYGLINLGGNVFVFGDNPSRSDGSWQVGIQKPFADADTYKQTVSVTGSGAVVTSGTYQRCFVYDNKLYHHILNPFTGYPANTGISGITIKSDTALLADCLSTACLVLGEAEGKALAEKFGVEIYTEK